MSGVYHQYQEVSDDPHAGNRTPGRGGEFQYPTGQPASRQEETDSFEGHPNIQYDPVVSSPTVSVSRQATQAVPPAPLFYRSLQQDLQAALTSSNQDYNTLLSLSQASQEELSWWEEQLPKWNGKPLRQSPEQVTISSDASQLG